MSNPGSPRMSSNGAMVPVNRLAGPQRRGSQPGILPGLEFMPGNASASLLARKALLASGPGPGPYQDAPTSPRAQPLSSLSTQPGSVHPMRAASISMSGFEPQLATSYSPRASISGAIPVRVSSNGSIAGDLSAYSLKRMSGTNNSLVQRARQNNVKQLGIKEFVARTFWQHYEKYKVVQIRMLHEALNPPLGQPQGIAGSYGAMSWGITGNSVDMHVQQKLADLKAAEDALPLQRDDVVTQYGKWLDSLSREETAAVVIQRWWRAWLDFRRAAWPDQYGELPQVEKPAPYVWSSSSSEDEDEEELVEPPTPVYIPRKKPGNAAGFGTSAVKPMNKAGSKGPSLAVSATTTENGAVATKFQPAHLIWTSAAPHLRHKEGRGPAASRYMHGLPDADYTNPMRRPKPAKRHARHTMKHPVTQVGEQGLDERASGDRPGESGSEGLGKPLRSQPSHTSLRSQPSLRSHPSQAVSREASLIQGLSDNQGSYTDMHHMSDGVEFYCSSDSESNDGSHGPHVKKAHRHHHGRRVRYATGPVLGHLKFWGTLQNPREQYDSRFFLPHLGEVHHLESERNMFNGMVQIRSMSKVLKPHADQSAEGPDHVHVIEQPSIHLHKSGLAAQVVSCQRTSTAAADAKVRQPGSRRPPRTAAAPGSPKWVRQMHAQYLGPGSTHRSIDAQSRRGMRRPSGPARPFTVPAALMAQQRDSKELALTSHALLTSKGSSGHSGSGYLPVLADKAPHSAVPQAAPLPASQHPAHVDGPVPCIGPVTAQVQDMAAQPDQVPQGVESSKLIPGPDSRVRTPVPMPVHSLMFTRASPLQSTEGQYVRHPSRSGQTPPTLILASQLLDTRSACATLPPPDYIPPGTHTEAWIEDALSSRAGSPAREGSRGALDEAPASPGHCKATYPHDHEEQEELFEQLGIPHLRPLLASVTPSLDTGLLAGRAVALKPGPSHPGHRSVELASTRGKTAPAAAPRFNQAETGSLAAVPGRSVGKALPYAKPVRKGPVYGRPSALAAPPAYKNPHLKLHDSRPFHASGPLQPSTHPYITYLPTMHPPSPPHPPHLPLPGPRLLMQQNHFSASGTILPMPAAYQPT